MRPIRSHLIVIIAAAIAAAAISSSCEKRPPMTPAETALRLLSIHGMLGKSPSERTKKDKTTLVDKDALDAYFVDLDQYDKFTGELFTGVILGALARNQSTLKEIKKEKTAEVTAGKATIYFELVDDEWKINLNKTIPAEMKKRASVEKERYEAAKSAGEAAARQQ